jgi:hypothetical protein
MDAVPSILPPAETLGEMRREQRNDLLLRALEAGAFDFLDFGTHKEGGLDRGLLFGGRVGLGVEIDEQMPGLAQARTLCTFWGCLRPSRDPTFG